MSVSENPIIEKLFQDEIEKAISFGYDINPKEILRRLQVFYEKYLSPKGVWRNDNNITKTGNGPGHIITATDGDTDIDNYSSVVILHVLDLGRRGFCPAFSGATGTIHFGHDQSTYDSALAEGRRMMLSKK